MNWDDALNQKSTEVYIIHSVRSVCRFLCFAFYVHVIVDKLARVHLYWFMCWLFSHLIDDLKNKSLVQTVICLLNQHDYFQTNKNSRGASVYLLSGPECLLPLLLFHVFAQEQMKFCMFVRSGENVHVSLVWHTESREWLTCDSATSTWFELHEWNLVHTCNMLRWSKKSAGQLNPNPTGTLNWRCHFGNFLALLPTPPGDFIGSP